MTERAGRGGPRERVAAPARKRFGQHFLHDRHVIDRIVTAARPGTEQCLVEIGPGRGALTEPLLAANGRLDVIEVDRDLAAVLRRRFGTHPGFTLHEADALKFDFAAISRPPGRRLRVVGNLPYNISTPLLFHLLDYAPLIEDMLFMLQSEVVDRLAAGAGGKHYGRLTLMVQYHCRVERLFSVPPAAFRPLPAVDSAVARLTPYREPPCPAKDKAVLETVIRTAFNQRRKTLRNALKGLVPAEKLAELGIDGGRRPQTVSLQEYVRISDTLAAR